MKNQQTVKCVCYGISGLIIGYLLAALMCHSLTMVDYSTGTEKTVVRLFPFSNEINQGVGAYNMLFRSPSLVPQEFHLVQRHELIPISGICETTEGGVFLMAQNQLTKMLFCTNLNESARNRIAYEFQEALKRGGVSAASDFANRTFDKLVLGADNTSKVE